MTRLWNLPWNQCEWDERKGTTIEENSKPWIWAYLRKPAISFQSLLQSPHTLARPELAKNVKWSPHLNYSSYVFLTGPQHILLVDCHSKGPQKASFGLCMRDRNSPRPACFVRGNSCSEMVQESRGIQLSDQDSSVRCQDLEKTTKKMQQTQNLLRLGAASINT
jgi:hypothetical protein